jgi:site-specific DNA-methyltransferase (adenine-specific)
MPEALSLPLDLTAPSLPRSSHETPELAVESDWASVPRRWAHAFHPICTYLGGLPPALAHALITRWSRPGDVVLDPFCGRGTVPLQACLERRVGVGTDRNPLAALLAGAVVDPPSFREARLGLQRLRIEWSIERPIWLHAADALAGDAAGPRAGAADLFHPVTLAHLLFLRSRLDRTDRTDRFLLAALAGILHGGRSSHLSDAMPNSFSLAPGYSRRWLEERGRRPPERDAFALLGRRLAHLFRDGTPPTRGIASQADARAAGRHAARALAARGLPERVRLVVTSPPYLRVIRYGAANWVRLWLLGEDPAAVDAALDAPATPAASAALLRATLDDLRAVLAEDAVVVLVLGEVARDRGRALPGTVDLATMAWEEAGAPAGYRLAGITSDPVDPGRKLTRLWGERAGRATRRDRILVMAPTEPGRRRALASASIPVPWGRTVGSAQLRVGPGATRAAAILAAHAADVSPRRPGVDGPARPDEEPRPRADDLAPAELHPPAAGAPVRA